MKRVISLFTLNTRVRELFIDAFRPFVSDINKYGLHSLRPGGATTAADLIMPFLTICKTRMRLKRFIKRQINWFRKYRFMTLILDA